MGRMIHGISEDGAVIFCAVDSSDIVARAEEIHHPSAVVTAALGRLLTAASIMGSLLKGKDDSVTLRLQGNGPTGTLLAVSDSEGNVRGCVDQPIVEIPLNSYGKLDVKGAVGSEGTLYVIRDIGLKDPYIGMTPIVSGEIAEDITHYYAVSEQIPTVCGLGVLVNPDLTVNCAGGYFIQLLPGATEEIIGTLEENIKALESVTQMLSHQISLEEMMNRALKGMNPSVLEQSQVSYRCTCSQERVERMLLSLGKEELENMANCEDSTEITCHFCDRRFEFDPKSLQKLAQEAGQNSKKEKSN